MDELERLIDKFKEQVYMWVEGGNNPVDRREMQEAKQAILDYVKDLKK